MALSDYLNPFRRKKEAGPSPAEEAAQRGRDRAAARQLGERKAAQDTQDAEAARRELDWRRQLDEQELRDELEATDIPPRVLDEEEAWALSGEWWSGFSSSNVLAIAFDAEDERLMVQYKDGSVYAYQPVTIQSAIDLYRTGSKGIWTWDHLRVRGSVFGFQVPYTHISGPSQKITGQELRKWMRTEQTRRKHGEIPASGRDAQGRTIRPRDIR